MKYSSILMYAAKMIYDRLKPIEQTVWFYLNKYLLHTVFN